MIEINGIRKKYKKKNVLEEITFCAEPGSCIGILGENGCGKSTLLSILAGTLAADAGSFLWNGEDMLRNEKLRAQIIGYVPQGTPLLQELSAKDNLRLWYTQGREELERELREGVLAMLGIPEYLKVPVSRMSGGMKKRLSIGCAVAHHPPVLLLDEPSAALDLICKERIYNYLQNFKKQGGTILLATHDVQELPLCDEILIMKNGRMKKYQYDGNIHHLVGKL